MIRLVQQSLQYLKWHHLLPQTRWGDAWHARLHCLRYNGHWPRAVGGGINDFLAFLKGSPEIDRPLRRLTSDKYLLKQWLDENLGRGWSVPTLAYLSSDHEIDQFAFPPRCVIKPTHLSGEIIFYKEGEHIDLQRVKGWLRRSHYTLNRERNYRGVKPGVLVEPWLDLQPGKEYKAYALRGEAGVLVVRDGQARPCIDTEGRLLSFGLTGLGGERRAQSVLRPQVLQRLPEVLEAVRKITANLAFARIDFYEVNQQLMIGEVTHVPMNGTVILFPPDKELEFTQIFFGERGFCLKDFPEVSFSGGHA